ncbi:MAG: hypothetical protein KKF33_04825 [Alphaproteobacteria bacterium]|nr:hypothetical protein [Alphaproteobacteria bacterium]
MLAQALAQAQAQFAKAAPDLDGNRFGVDLAAYGEAMALAPISNSVWNEAVVVKPAIRATASGSCQRYAAFVILPPEEGVVSLVLCPQFFSPGADGLRRLTILHEMVHAVAGRDECQAMALAAAVEQAASGRFTPVDAYWRANDCASSRFRLP